MNVDWQWIMQRPHFIAHKLSLSFNIQIIYPYALRRDNLTKNNPSNMNILPFFSIPLGGRFSPIRKCNILILKFFSFLLIRFYKPDIIWISSPELFDYLPKKISSNLIYDCMDDVLSFPSNYSRKIHIIQSESNLINTCSKVFCSSASLRNKLITRYGNAHKYLIINNALEPSALNSPKNFEKSKKAREVFIIGYIGTISSWFDFDAIFTLLNKIETIEIHLIGPVVGLNDPPLTHKRLKYLGPCNHNNLNSKVKDFDAFIMPFHLTELVQSVDPVKIYEYIYFNKPIFCLKYNELEKFSEFVDFYNTYDELVNLVKKYKNGTKKKYTNKTRDKFISLNTWAHRVKTIKRAIISIT